MKKKKKGNANWVRNLIKGRIAETLIEQLFLKLDFHVFKYGIENTVQGIIPFMRGNEDNTSGAIKSMPDFIVFKNGGKPYFVEVKYRENGRFISRDVNKFPDYHDSVLVVLVSKESIKCLSIEELRNGKEITARCSNYLYDRQELGIENQKEVIATFLSYAKPFYEGLSSSNQ